MRALTVIAEDRPGLLAEVTAHLGNAGVDILDIDGHAVAGQAVLSVRAEPYRRAFRCLADAGLRVVGHDDVLVRLEREPGALAKLSRRLADAQIDVRGLHIISQDANAGIVVLETAAPERARELLADMLVHEAPERSGNGGFA